MIMHIPLACLYAVATMLVAGDAAFGQTYPNRPVKMVATAAGGAGDVAARIIAQHITGPLGQPVVIENRGTGIIPGEIVAKATPDGYTLLIAGTVIWLSPFLQDHVPFDPVRDFAPITLAVTTPNVLVVHPSLPVKTVKDLIALARSKPGALNYGTTGSGSSYHLAGELFKAMARVDLVRVAYKASAQGLIDLIAGQLHVMFPTAPAGLPYLKSAKLKALAVTSAGPSALLPGLITVAASGLPGYESGSILGIFAPAKTPDPIIQRLHQEIVRVLSNAEQKEKFLGLGLETVGNTPEQLGTLIKAEMTKWGKVIKHAGIKAE